MKSAPIINVSTAATTPQVKQAGNGSAPEQSFGQVLAQQVNANPPASSQPPAASNAQNAQNSQTAANSQAPAPAPSAGGSSNGNSSTSGSSSTGGTTATGHGKNGKTKSAQNQDGSDSSNAANGTQQNSSAADAAANGSAQLLALVSNVQQNTATTSTTDATDALSALSGSTSAAQTALTNFQTAVADAGKNSATDATAATDDKDALTSELSAKDLKQSDFAKQLDTSTSAADQSVKDLTIDTKAAATTAQPALDLAASAEKDIQAGLASLDAAAAKSADALQAAAAAGAAAIPAAINMQQTNLAAQEVAASNTIAPQVGSTGWDQSLGQKVVWMVAGGQQSASLTLNPPDLGPMQVVLNVTNSHATATFTAAQPEVRQALENAMPKLREMLGDAGIQLGQTSVNAGNAQQQQNFAGQNNQKSSSGSRGQGTDTAGAIDSIGSVVGAAQVSSAGLGLVDTFA